MKRTISTIPLLFSSVSAIMGSGWLFSIYFTAKYAGPAALIAWIIGGIFTIIIAFVFAELTAMLPITGSSTRIPHYTHGAIVSFIFAWMIWLSYTSLVPTEVQAVIQYISYYYPSLLRADSGLSTEGYVTAAFLMIIISMINIFTLRWLMRSNTFFTVLKVLIPSFIGIMILIAKFSPEAAFSPAHSSFIPMGIHGIFAALTSGGIVFAFNGFKQACEIAGEAKNPAKALPLAVIGSVLFCLIIFLILQLAFLSSLTAEDLISGWAQMHLGGESQSPLASIIYKNNMRWLIPILYTGAILGPLAASLMFCQSSSRSLYGMAKNGYIPLFFQHLTPQGNPVYAIIANFVVGMFLFAPLPGWDKMVAFLSSLMAITYSIAPVALLTLRYQAPNQRRPFRLPFEKVWCYIAFTICTLFAYWSGWDVIYKLLISLIISIVILLAYRYLTKRGKETVLNWHASVWIWPFFAGLGVISYLGSFTGGQGFIPFGWDILIIAIFCAFILWLSVKFKHCPTTTQKHIEKLVISTQKAE